MTRKKKVLLFSILAVVLCICAYLLIKAVRLLFEGRAVASLPRYTDSSGYVSDGFQDYTIYREYRYEDNPLVLIKLRHNAYFEKVTEESKDAVLGYYKNFHGWLGFTDFEDKVTFRADFIDCEDYWYVDNRYPEEDRKYHCYDMYYFDVQTMTLFLMHNNI